MKKTKKIISILLIAIMVLTFIIPCCVKAYSFNLGVSISSPANAAISEGEQVKLEFKLADIDMGEYGMNTLGAYLDYDRDVFEHITDEDVEGNAGWSIGYNGEEGNSDEGKMVFSTLSSGLKNDKIVGYINFTVKSNLSDTVKANAKPFRIYDISGCVGNETIYEEDKEISYTFDNGTTPPPVVETIEINKTSTSIAVGATEKLTATSSTGASITWTSSNPSAATVNSEGLVTGVAAGTTTITAKGNTATATCVVTVTGNQPTPETETIRINKTTASVNVNGTLALIATSSTGANITWTSSNTDVATVSNSGLVTGKKVGSTTITAKGNTATATCFVTVTEDSGSSDPDPDGKFTDFSNAKFELKKVDHSSAQIEITGVTPKAGSKYYYIINSTNAKPIEDALALGSMGNLITLSDKEQGKLICENKYYVAGKVELNQDLYISILEKNEADEAYVVTGKKLERFAEPKYSDAFYATFMSTLDNNPRTQIVTNFTHNKENNRKIEIKIGKITDIKLLQKIKNKDASGFADLLSYAKSNAAIYDETLKANDNEVTIEYNSFSTTSKRDPIVLKNVADASYYFLYIKADDENGKYINQEAVTLSYSALFKDGYSLHFYGSDDFKWADFGNVPADGKDGTEAGKEIPQTGTNEMIAVAVFGGLTLSAVGAFIGYRKNRI